MNVTAHEKLEASVLARGLATLQILAMCGDPDPRRRRLAKIALGLRHPIYARSF